MGLCGIYVRTSIEKENTSIEQQKQLGINFCKKNSFTYQIYEDIGKSGYELEDEKEPFKNRSGMKKLLSDIENKIVDKVWVFEHSRLSRRDITSFVLTKIFNKHNITLYEKDKEFDMNNPQNQMIQGILSQISQYERHLIVDRTKRGLHDTFNRGIRGFNSVYGYKKSGKGDSGYMIWEPVESEIENVKHLFKKYLEGTSIKQIVSDIHKDKDFSGKKEDVLYKKWRRMFKQFVYTGYSLNTDGLEVFNKFKRCEIDSIRELSNKKYYVKSIPFPIHIVSIEDWIQANEKLQVAKVVYRNTMRKTNSEFVTGLIDCPYCELRYYIVNDKGYLYYKHFPNSSCKQKPKSKGVKIFNNLFELFFFYFYLVYDDTKVLIENSQHLVKVDQMKIKEKVKAVEVENKKYDNQIESFQSIYEKEGKKENPNAKLLELTLVKESELILKKEKNVSILNMLKVKLDELVKKFEEDKMELTYYDVKETVVNFFENLTNEEKRASLIKVIKRCKLFGKYMVIDTGKLLFIFHVDEDNILPEKIYNQFKTDKKFKDNFLYSSEVVDDKGMATDKFFDFIGIGLESKDRAAFEKKLLKKYSQEKIDSFIQNIVSYSLVRHLGDISIQEYSFKDKEMFDMKAIMKRKLQGHGIDYSLFGKEKIISFTKL